MTKKINKVLEQGGWLSKSQLFTTESKTITDVVVLTPSGKIVKGTWNYKNNHLKCGDGTVVVAWKSLNNYICSLNRFQRFIRKMNGKESK